MTEISAPASLNPLAAILAEPDRLKDLPIETVSKLYEIDKEMRRERARQDFAAAFTAVQVEMTPVRRAATNSHTRSRYARLEHVTAMLDPIIQAHGFSRSVSTEPGAADGLQRFVLVVRHVGGHEERHYLDAPLDNIGIKGQATKTALHGMASSATYCERHLICKVFGVQTVDDDDGNAGALGPGAEPITEAQVAEIGALADEVGADKRRLCGVFEVDSLAGLTQVQFRPAMQMLRAKAGGGRKK